MDLGLMCLDGRFFCNFPGSSRAVRFSSSSAAAQYELIGKGLMVLQQFRGGNAIGFYASSIFEKAGFSETVGTTVRAVVQILTTLLSVLLMDKLGRRLLLMVSALGICLGALLVGVQDIQLWKEELTPIMVFIGIVVYNASFGLGLGGIPWLIMSEIFPINMKGSAGSLVSLVNCFTSFIITLIFRYFVWYGRIRMDVLLNCKLCVGDNGLPMT